MNIDKTTFDKLPDEIKRLFVKAPNPGSDEVVGLFPDTKTNSTGKNSPSDYNTKSVFGAGTGSGAKPYGGDSGSAARFFYCAKSSKAERNKGLNRLNCAIIDICKDENTEQVTSLLRDILESIPNLNIDESGLRLTVQYPKDTMSTILTTINQITDLKTYSLLMQSPTRESMKDVLSKMMNGLSPVESVKSLSELTMTTGTSQEKGGLATEDVRNAMYQRLLKLKDESEWKPRTSTHPTVKPVRLMQYLVKLVTPVGGIVLDPFNGSGTTGIACKLEGFEYVGIELDPEYCTLSEARIEAWAIEAEQVSML